jgi:hypothetical protein
MAAPIETGGSARKLHRRAERSLSSLVMLIKFNLISLMAGVVLAPLAEYAKDLLCELHF